MSIVTGRRIIHDMCMLRDGRLTNWHIVMNCSFGSKLLTYEHNDNVSDVVVRMYFKHPRYNTFFWYLSAAHSYGTLIWIDPSQWFTEYADHSIVAVLYCTLTSERLVYRYFCGVSLCFDMLYYGVLFYNIICCWDAYVVFCFN